MTKSIDTLASDIKGLFGAALRGESHTFEEEVLAKFGGAVAMHVADSVVARTKKRPPETLYMSEIGKPCLRQLWYSVHYPELAEKMQEHTLFKFLYGNVIEEVALTLAEAAGHKVELRQGSVEWFVGGWTIRGRLDAVIDGVMVDVKSCSPFGYKKFTEGLTDENDSFGYRAQLSGYNPHGLYEQQGFLAIDKQNGHVGYFESPRIKVQAQAADAVDAVRSLAEPPRKFALKDDGKSGNEKLGTECSYCPFKRLCWRNANNGHGLKAYSYSYGPTFLGVIVREPKVPEIELGPDLPVGAQDRLVHPALTAPLEAHRPATGGVLRSGPENLHEMSRH